MKEIDGHLVVTANVSDDVARAYQKADEPAAEDVRNALQILESLIDGDGGLIAMNLVKEKLQSALAKIERKEVA